MPPISLGRNDPCPCNSGKKYKKCCLDKDRHPPTTETQSESFTIKMDALTPEESKEHYPPFSEEDEELLYELYCDLNENPECIDSEDCDYFQELAMLRLKYPDHPRILNYIANGYQCLGQKDKMREIITETYEKFPNYLFAQIGLAHIHLQEGMLDKALEVLKGAYTLQQLYPQREVFHISEFKTFNSFMVHYFCAIKNFKQAEIYLHVLEEVLEPDDDLLQTVQKKFKIERGIYYFGARMNRLLRSDKK
jgi:tetratricopeptide (TPR) repeat protein